MHLCVCRTLSTTIRQIMTYNVLPLPRFLSFDITIRCHLQILYNQRHISFSAECYHLLTHSLINESVKTLAKSQKIIQQNDVGQEEKCLKVGQKNVT